ncbi:RlpA-like double-psi beta-barrel-protein domain-containing protein-containing protein [Mycena rosella]|uniref:RlpA-like double-psi beta-barrel-protein domain-containing protein-containing protein n=1 Tax=Mycena rosella TaxID=1033263 RepID=A0AAD7G378_MYCRO|nr:RlpA-like double-psi beta-barrel-protein domain-containing protein-containing protein [Mycena rosella]
MYGSISFHVGLQNGINSAFAALLVTVTATAVHASPVAPGTLVTSKRDTDSDLAKRTAGNIYVCNELDWMGWGSTPCTVFTAHDTCLTLPSAWAYQIGSIGPDAGATCYGYSGTTCGGTSWSFTYPGDATGGWSTASPWENAIGSFCCDTTGGGCSGGGGVGTYSGDGTYYYPNGGTGACGTTLQNSDYIVALSFADYASGAHCGDQIIVYYNGNSVTVTVEDACAGCSGDSIDLSSGAMAALDPNYINDGRISVTWSYV